MKVIIFIWIGILVALAIFAPLKVPFIMLPKGAQFNTFGRLPLAKVVDTGDFQEKEGDEYNCHNACFGAVEQYCRSDYYVYHFNDDMKMSHNKGWLTTKQPAHRKRSKKEVNLCVNLAHKICSGNCPPKCSDLAKIGGIWTCMNEIYGGGIGWN